MWTLGFPSGGYSVILSNQTPLQMTYIYNIHIFIFFHFESHYKLQLWALPCGNHLVVVEGLCVSMMLQAMSAGTCMFLVGPLKSDRL